MALLIAREQNVLFVEPLCHLIIFVAKVGLVVWGHSLWRLLLKAIEVASIFRLLKSI
jgi:hypothetical protein